MNGIDDLPGLRVFERVVALGSLTAAAAELGLSLAVVSKRLAGFEQRLGVRLVNRSTRRLAVTDEGKQLYPHALRIVNELEQATDTLSRQREEISGVLRVTAPNSFGRRRLVPLLADFVVLYPQLRIQLHLSDDVVDLMTGGFDLAIRYGELRDSRMVARVLAQNRRILCASPDYLERRGQPQHLSDLEHHDCILIGSAPMTEWRFGGEGRTRPVRVTARIACNDGEAVHAMALQGMGIVLKSIWDVAEDLESGRLLQVLPRHAVSAAPLNAVYLNGHHLAPRVRAFIDFLVVRLKLSHAAGLADVAA
ncbi:LysR family transcriptional regulator [Burkholderia sp. WAC0059]|uniref:LysR family transcriptional regulator n=1 Tax=Burkholderia sp. WAC0059 TaxID=2066022 RepID=UPI000C7EF3B6|nr:LysR family transcriptional regulator [Burkholderia sp. WAC0059]PLZ02598.1 LysR family transcriptional regulator [Burkholderia sp. WAC0059]